MKTILTLKYGDKYDANAVNSIYEHTEGKYNYVCVTDDPKNLDPNIQVIYMEDEPDPGCMEKINLFKYNDLGTILYLDLDVRIQKPIDHLFDLYNKNPLIIWTWWKDKGIKQMNIHDFPYRSDFPLSNFNSSVMLWEDLTHIYEYYTKKKDEYIVKYPNGDDTFLYHEGFTFEHLPEHEVYSYLFAGRKYRPEYSICILNGLDHWPEIEKEYDELCLHQVGH